MNDPYNENDSGRRPPDDLGRSIEAEVRRTLDAVTATIRDAAREVGDTLREDESLQRTVQELGAAARSGMESVRQGISRAQREAERAQRRKKRKKKRDYAKKAAGALSEAGGMLLVSGILGVLSATVWLEDGEFAGTAVLGVIAAWFLCGSLFSFFKSRTLRRIASYQSVLGERAYCSLAELSELTGRSQTAIRRDLHKLISMGKYEDVYLAPDGSRLFSNETAYRLYLAHRTQSEEARYEARAEALRQEAAQPAPAAEPEEAAAPGVLEECRAFLSELREQQRLFTDAAVLEQTQRIEAQTVRVIAWLEKHPEGEGQIRRFVNYYMPTTLKLVRTYNEVSPQADSSSVAASIQTDICGILSTINTAFQSLQNNLLKDTAMDVSAEISALETVLAQEGLTDTEFGI